MLCSFIVGGKTYNAMQNNGTGMIEIEMMNK